MKPARSGTAVRGGRRSPGIRTPSGFRVVLTVGVVVSAAAVSQACVSSTEPEPIRLESLLFAGILLGHDSTPVNGATVGARVYLFDECGTGSKIDEGSTQTDGAGGYSLTLTLQHGVRQCVAFGASKTVHSPTMPGDTGTALLYPAWALDCTPGLSVCTETEVAILPPSEPNPAPK